MYAFFYKKTKRNKKIILLLLLSPIYAAHKLIEKTLQQFYASFYKIS